MYSSSFEDAMIQISDTWIRASQIEMIQRSKGAPTNSEDVVITFISGHTLRVNMNVGEAAKIAGMAVGQP